MVEVEEKKEYRDNWMLLRRFFYNIRTAKLHGEYKEYYDNGNLFIWCSYKEHKLHGEYRLYDKNGNIKDISYYHLDKQITKEQYLRENILKNNLSTKEILKLV